MTTFSRRFIRRQKGFLNDSTMYRDKFYLQDTEYIYVGKVNSESDFILFKRQTKHSSKQDSAAIGSKDIVLHTVEFHPSIENIEIDKVQVETIENSGNLNEKIALNEVFSIPYSFNLSNYVLLGEKSFKETTGIEKLCFIKNSKSMYEVIFKIKDLEKGYRFPSKKVVYFTK